MTGKLKLRVLIK